LILVFDLDEVLYDEITFVKSGLDSVSKYLYDKFSVPHKESKRYLDKRLQKGREKILDDLLEEFELYSKKRVKECLSVYRFHRPKIQLYEDADECLKRLKKFPIYIVTDGNKIVQKNKLLALKLYQRVNHCFLTSNYGLQHAKPSAYCFLKICERENVKPSDIIYIADNPNKDFVGIKPLGFKTIRLLKGRYKNVKKEKKYDAEFTIKSLSQLNYDFIKKVKE
jgi:putative hydrolase of the HAD superfamily